LIFIFGLIILSITFSSRHGQDPDIPEEDCKNEVIEIKEEAIEVEGDESDVHEEEPVDSEAVDVKDSETE
jgi:hypothetical protein